MASDDDTTMHNHTEGTVHDEQPADATATDDASPEGISSDEARAEDAVELSAPKRAPRKRAPRKRAAAPAIDPTAESETLEAQVVEAGETTGNVALDATPGADIDATAEADDEGISPASVVAPTFGLLFQAPQPVSAPRRRVVVDPEPVDGPSDSAEPDTADDDGPEGEDDGPRRRRRRGGKGRRSRADGDVDGTQAEATDQGSGPTTPPADGEETPALRRRRRRRAGGALDPDDEPGVVTRVREPRRERDEVTGVKGSTRLEAKKQRRREGREAGRRRTIITEAEFLARRESVERVMLVRENGDRTQIGVLEDGILVEHYISRETNVSMAGNIYLGRVQNVLPSMEAAFVDIGKGRNAVLYAGEVNWDAAGLDSHTPKRIEHALTSGENVLVQVTKDPIGHKGARLTSQISLPGRYLVYVPNGAMTGISRKLPDTERARLKKILRDLLPANAGVIVRTAAEGASEDELRADVERLTATWEQITTKAAEKSKGKGKGGSAPILLHGEPDLTVRVIRDIFNEDFAGLVVSGERAWSEVSAYVDAVAPDLVSRVSRWTGTGDLFADHRVDEQLAKAMDRKVWLPSGGSLVIDRTEAMTVVDVNTGKFVGSGGNLEETVTKNNIEAAEEIVRQLRLRDIGGIIVIDFIDMVLESNRELVVRRLLECLGRDRTKHQVAEVTSLGLVQMTRKRVGAGLIEVFSEPCEHCNGRGLIVHDQPVDRAADGPIERGPHNGGQGGNGGTTGNGGTSRSTRGRRPRSVPAPEVHVAPNGPTAAQIAAAAHAAAIKSVHVDHAGDTEPGSAQESAVDGALSTVVVEQARSGDQGVDRGADAPEETQPTDAGQATQQLAVDEGEASAAIGLDSPADGSHEQAMPSSSGTRRGGRRRRGRVVAPAGPPRSTSDATPA